MKRLLCILLALTMSVSLFTACGGDETTTSGGKGEPAVEATPEPTPEPYEANVLTGYEKTAGYAEGQRITAVMVNNIAQCRPQRGLSEADMLFEIKVEGGITRFMALFTDHNNIPDIGPVRSARDQFFRLVLPWQPLYVHIGQSVVQKEYITNYNYDEWNLEGNFDGNLYYRNRDRVNWVGNHVDTEHTAYTNGQLIADYVERMMWTTAACTTPPSSILWTTVTPPRCSPANTWTAAPAPTRAV